MFAFSSPYTKDAEDINEHIVKHGDGVKDVAFLVEDANA
jgi:4-hydroxyphenylpyruvate dioxygenase